MSVRLTATVLGILVLLTACGPSTPPTTEAAVMLEGAPAFDESFWATWSDGQAEMAGYDLTIPRYGQPRKGVAVTIFVAEKFSNSARVKADPGKHSAEDEFSVMKLNLAMDFPTGVYDYNEMMSRFVALDPVNGRPAGSLTKVSFSSQEWCGHVYHQALFDASRVRTMLHSYFDGEADREAELAHPGEGFAEDSLHHWARGMAWPVLEPGESRQVDFLPSLQSARHRHRNLTWGQATLSRSASPEETTVPAGTFDVERLTVAIKDGVELTFFVETAAPHRIIRWESSEGEEAAMLASKRMKYWQMNKPGGEEALASLGLAPRSERTP